jgi:NAD(P)-dependent dehydrogenase (short-subunit alcohol dehydrogenase family)
VEFSGKNILVVGASSGMGRTISLRFAQAGARVAVTARRAAMLQDLVKTIEQGNGVALALPADATDEDAAANVVEKAIESLGGIDMVLLNAGGAPAIYMPR